MQLYLPIAEMSVSIWLFLGMGMAVGFLSGLFGVGGGFLMTPLLIFSGIPPAVAVGTEAPQIVATSASGAIAQWRRNNVDVKLGSVLLAGGVFGSFFGVEAVKILRQLGQFEFFVSLSYVIFLGTIGTLMLAESVQAIRSTRSGKPTALARRPGQHIWVHKLPIKLRFHRSKLYISAVPPLLIGMLVGLLAAIIGVGGGFIMVPAMIYLLRVPTNVAVGTSLFQIVFVTGVTTVLQAGLNKSVDVVLALLLIVGGVIGAQLGARSSGRLKGEQLRFLLAGLVLLVGVRVAFSLFSSPTEIYTLSTPVGGSR
jgi:uncharacterized membrane protein YfcA